MATVDSVRDRLIAAALGLVAAAVALAGGALLVSPGPRALESTAVVACVALGSAAVGTWRPRGVGRARVWVVAVIALVAAALLAIAWGMSGELRSGPFSGFLGLLVFVAYPLYLLIRLATGIPDSGVATLGGAAAGILLGAFMIPLLDPAPLFVLLAGAVAATGTMRPGAVAGAVPPEGLAGRVAVITGVGPPGQVGYHLAREFVRQGARVVAVGRSVDVEALREIGAVPVRADLATEAGARAAVEAAVRGFGGIDVLVNAAGGLRVIRPVGETSVEEWRGEIERNATTAFLMCRAALPHLRERRGAVINFASPVVQKAAVAGLGAYAAGKAAVVALTRTLAVEEKLRVRAYAIAPAMIDTEQNRREAGPPGPHWVTRDRIARAVLELASDVAGRHNGGVIHVAGEST